MNKVVSADGQLKEDREAESKSPADSITASLGESSMILMSMSQRGRMAQDGALQRPCLRSLLIRCGAALKLDGFLPEYHGLYKLLRKLLQDGATHEEPCISATAVLMRLLSMRVVSMNLPGAQGTRRRVLTQFFNHRADKMKDQLNDKVRTEDGVLL